MLFQDRFQRPPAPGEPREAPEAYPSGREHLAMAISGLGMLGMARMGLRSFGSDGDLFGVFGEKAADPMQAVIDFVREGRKIMNEADSGSSVNQSVLASRADTEGPSKLDDTVEQIAYTHQSRRERIESLSQTITQQKVRSAIDRSYSRQTDEPLEDRLAKPKRQKGQMKVVGEGDDKRVVPGEVESERSQSIGGPFGPEADEDTSPLNNYNRQGRRRALLGLTETEDRARRLAALGQSSAPMEEGPFSGFVSRADLTNDVSQSLQYLGKSSATTTAREQRALISQLGTNSGLTEDTLRAAWRKYQQAHPFEVDVLQDPSPHQIESYATKQPALMREIEKEVERRNTQSSTDPITFADRDADQHEVTGATRASVAYADPVRRGAFDAIDDVDEFASYGDLGASEILRKDRVTEKLTSRVEEKFKWLEKSLDDRRLSFNFERTQIDGDEYHEVFRMAVQVDGGEKVEFDVPLPSEYGTYRLPGQERSFVSPATKLPRNDFFAGRDAIEMIEETRGARVARPDELTLLSITEHVTKMLNDLQGGRGVGAVEDQLRRLRKEHFNKKSLVNDSIPDVLTKGLQVRPYTEKFFEEVRGSARRRQQVEQGLDSAQRLRDLFKRNNNYFAADTEFMSPDVMAERGQTTRGTETPYEVSGQIYSADEAAPQAEITYHPNLFENKPEGTDAKEYRNKIREGIESFQDQIGRSEEDINQLMDNLETGSLEVKIGNDTYDLLDPNQETPDVIPDRDAGERLDRYFTRVQSRLLDEFDAEFTVGQNFLDSDISIYQKMFERADIDMPSALQESNVIDLMNISHATGASPTGSRSLFSIVGQRHGGMTEDEVKQVMGTVRNKFNQFAASVHETENMTAESAERLFMDSIEQTMEADFSEEQKKFWRSMRETLFGAGQNVFENPNSLDQHTASFDAYMTGAFGARAMNEYLDSVEGQIALDRARDVMNDIHATAGDRMFTERHAGMPYDRPGEDDRGVDPFLVNQDAATMGAGSMVHTSALPFARLQNPVRQLYQRNKPRRLVSEIERPGTVGDLPRRPRKPGGEILERLRKEDPTAEAEGNLTTFKTYSAEQGEVVEYRGTGLFAGYGTATPEERMMRGGRPEDPSQPSLDGGRANEMQFGVTSRAAMIPRNTIRTWESQAQGTAARREALQGGFGDPLTATASVDPVDIGQTEDMRSWIEEQAKGLGVELYEGPTREQAETANKKLLEEIYMLNRVLQDRQSGASDAMKQMLRMAINNRFEAIEEGTPPSMAEKARKALRKAQEARHGGAKESPVVGDRAPLFQPSGTEGIVTNPMLGPGNEQVVGIDVSVEINEENPEKSEIRAQFIEDPGTVIKSNTIGAKTSTAAPVPGSQVGAFGEQVVMGAPFEKLKRKDFAGYIRAQVERIHRQVNEELQYLAQKGQHQGLTGSDPFNDQRQEVIDRAARSLSELTQDMSTEDIKNKVLVTDQYADYIDFDYVDEFVRQAEDATNMDIMNAADEAGLTVKSTMKMAMQAGGVGRRRAAQVMKDQVDSVIGELENVLDEGLAPTDELDIDTQLSREQREQQIKDTISELEKQSGTYQKLFDNKLEDLSDERLNQGSLYDFFVSEDKSDQITAAYQILSPEERPANPVTGASQLGEDFEEGVGRATKRKRSSLLSTALMGHAAQQTPGGVGGPAGDLFQAWLGSKAGAAAFSDKKFREEVARALQQEGIHATDWDASNLKWNEEEQELEFTHPQTGNVHTLDINPMATLTQTQRARVGVVSMIKGEMQTETVAGHTIGGDDRVLSVKFDGDDLGKSQISKDKFKELYGKEARARQHYEFTQGVRPEEVGVETEKFDDPYVYFGKGARPGESPIFSERFDFVEVNLHGDLADEDLRSVAQKLEEAGLSNERIGRALAGGDHFIESALTHGIEDPEEAERVKDLVNYVRSGEDKGFGGNILMRTLTGEDRPNIDAMGGGVQRASIGRFQDLLESTEAIATVQQSIKRIKQEAEKLDPQKTADQQKLKDIVRQEIEQTMGAFQEVEQLFAHTLKESVDHVGQQMEEYAGRYLGGEYSIAEPQTQVLPNLRTLTETAQFGKGEGPSEAFVDEVKNLARKNQPRAAETENFDKNVRAAAEDIYSYLSEQHRNYGEQYHKYQGFGVGEGFLSRGKAQKVLEQMKVSHKNTDFGALQDDLEPVTEPTNLQGDAQERLREVATEQQGRIDNLKESAELEKRIAQQEVKQPGSTPGILTINARQPDFTMLAGYETGRMSVMGDEAMSFLGMEPDQVHMMSNPLTTWSRREDFDFDLNYMATIGDTAVSAMMRETRAKGMPEQIALLHQVVEGVGDDLRGSGEAQLSREGPAASYDTHQTEYNDIQGVGDNPVTAQRVTTPFYTGDEGFDEPIAGMFGFSGQAREAVSSAEEARRAYALQQSIVGQFGAYSKQGAVQTMQRETDFMNAMSQMVETAKSREGTSSFAGMFEAPRDKVDQLKNMTGEKQMTDGWEFMKQTLKDVEAARQGLGGTAVFDPLHAAALAESEIAQGVAIEKYKSGDPQRQARRMDDILKTLHGNHRGGYSGFDEAMDALLDEEFGGMQVQDFFVRPEEARNAALSQEQVQKTARQRARRAFRLQYNMNVSMQMLADQGISGDYLSRYANVAQSQVPMDQKLQQVFGGGASSLATETPEAAAQALGADTQQQIERFFASESQRVSMLESTIGRPSTYEEQAQKMVKNLPTSVKGMGVAAAAATAVFASMDGPKSRAEGETFDLPRERYEEPVYERGDRNYTRQSLDAYQQSRRDLEFKLRPRAASGRSYRARTPPTIEADY